MLELAELEPLLKQDLKRQIMSPSVLLSQFRFIDPNSRKSTSYTDPLFVPVYYYLGKHLKPKSLLEIGFWLGLFSGCFHKSCDTVETMTAFQRKTDDYYSPRLAIKNVKDNYRGEFDMYTGEFLDEIFQQKLKAREWELVFVNEQLFYDEHKAVLEAAWSVMPLGGVIVVDYLDLHQPSREALESFCRVKNTTFSKFTTRYGLGIVQK